MLPQALQLIQGARTKENVLAAFAALNPGDSDSRFRRRSAASPTDTACISDVALNLLNLRNPVTGDIVMPAPRAGGTVIGNDIDGRSVPVGGNPFIRQRNVVPGGVHAGPVHLQARRAAHGQQPPERHRLLRRVPRARSVSRSVEPGLALHAASAPIENATVALSDTHIFGSNKVNEMRGGVFYLNNTRQLDDPFLGLTNDSVGVPNPATFFDSSTATTRLGHYIGRPGGTMERFSFGGPNDSFNKRRAADLDDRRHAQLDHDGARAAHGRRVPAQRIQHQPARGAGDGVREVRQLHAAPARAGDRGRHAVRHHRQAVPLQRLQPVPRRRLAAVAVADAQRSASATSSSAGRRRSTAGSATSTSRR